MTPNKQLSPVIRISRGERDASARATHLEAAFEKYSKTTIERKQMSTTTNFKRIALVAVASLGLGVLSSVPSQATINSDSLTLSSTTASQTNAETYTATSATATLSFIAATNDSISVTAALVSGPTGNAALPVLKLVETSSATIDSTSATVYGGWTDANTAAKVIARANGAVSAKFAVYIGTDSITAPVKTGTYVVKLTPAAIGVGALVGSTAQTLTITVSEAPTKDTKASAAKTTAYITVGETITATATTEKAVAVSKTPVAGGTTAQATIRVTPLNAAGVASAESITAEITGAGILGIATWSSNTTSNGSLGRSLTLAHSGTNVDISVFADGVSGVGTITIKGSVTGTVLATKTVTFYGAVAKITATADKAQIGVRSTDTLVVSAIAYDAANVQIPSFDMYVTSSDTTVISTGTCGATAAKTICTFTGVKAGTASITLKDEAAAADVTVTSNAVSIRVAGGASALANVKVAFDKATYAPGEVATITVTPVDAAGLVLADDTYTVFSSTGLVTDYAFLTSPASNTLTLAGAHDGGVDYTGTVNGVAKYKVYMPLAEGKVTVKYTTAATGYTPTTAAGVAGSISATVTSSGSAALAAVNALATTVASLRTLIVTLTNLVLKIQKKVKA